MAYVELKHFEILESNAELVNFWKLQEEKKKLSIDYMWN